MDSDGRIGRCTRYIWNNVNNVEVGKNYTSMRKKTEENIKIFDN